MQAVNVVALNDEVKLPTEQVLRGAIEADLENVLVVGWEKNGDLYLASGDADARDLVLLLRIAEHRVLRELGE